VSHAAERKEKDCLNCGTNVYGRYCHVCGQENVVPKETFGKLLVHFFYDITHFDGKFFETVKDLFFRPGFLSDEYVKGRRAAYLNPIRMYIFTSAVFFLFFFTIFNSEKLITITPDKPLTPAEREKKIEQLNNSASTNRGDTAALNARLAALRDTSRPVTQTDLEKFDTDTTEFNFFSYKIDYRTVHEYDSAQALLPASSRDGWIKKRMMHRGIVVGDDLRTDAKDVVQKWGDVFIHRLPYLLFISLPIFALILKLLYSRRKEFFYADHLIFTIHHYIFSFLLLLIFFAVSQLRDLSGWGIFTFLRTILIILWPVYLFLAMRRFYQQGWFKTFFKLILLNLLGLIMLFIFFIISIFLIVL
jgi:hypothetical protein